MAPTDQLQEVKIMLHGTAASEGIGIGKVMLIEEHSLEYTPRTVTDTEAESQRFKAAVDAFCYNTEKQAENLRSSAGEKEAEILAGHIQIIKDPYLSGEIEKLIADGQCAESALEHMCDMFITMFSAADDELTKQRAADVRDIKSGVLGILLGVNEIKVSDAPKGTVLVARELTPSVTAGIVKENIAGIITETGGTTSHSAILARALEIPAVLSVEGVASSLKNGDTVVVDGSEGAVIVNPDDNTVAEYSKKRDAFLAERKELENYRGRETKSASGEVYELFCNIGKPEDAVKAVDADGEGVGLFRTEFLFMDRTSIPTEDEQFEAYKKAALILKGKSLIIRTLDIGGDKDIPYLGLEKEENPFMGFRAIRYCLKNRELFKSQIKAILRASAFGDIKIMFPLITTMDELREGKKLVAECKADLRNMDINFNENIQVGVMVETASAAVIADMLAKEADFFSIGTNDLTGYTMACDRGNNDVSYLYSPLQPSVLRMIKRTIECGVQNGISVGMCGEAAANKLMIPLLISFGLTEFSVSAPSVLNVRKIISTWTKEEADKVTAKVLEMSTQQEIVEYLKSVV
jgi:phosphotransferase system enzyme I (PtsI)